MTAVLRDAYGLAVSTSSRAAVDAHDRGVRALLGFGADTVECFRQALAADPDFVLARAALAVALYLDEQIPAARAEMERAIADGAVLARELGHLPKMAEWKDARARDATLLSEWQVYRLVDVNPGAWSAFQFLVSQRLREEGVDVRADGSVEAS